MPTCGEIAATNTNTTQSKIVISQQAKIVQPYIVKTRVKQTTGDERNVSAYKRQHNLAYYMRKQIKIKLPVEIHQKGGAPTRTLTIHGLRPLEDLLLWHQHLLVLVLRRRLQMTGRPNGSAQGAK
jgi:hypothetical protein